MFSTAIGVAIRIGERNAIDGTRKSAGSRSGTAESEASGVCICRRRPRDACNPSANGGRDFSYVCIALGRAGENAVLAHSLIVPHAASLAAVPVDCRIHGFAKVNMSE